MMVGRPAAAIPNITSTASVHRQQRWPLMGTVVIVFALLLLVSQPFYAEF